MTSKVRFIIVSMDAMFCKGLKDVMLALPNVELVVNVNTQQDAENKISRGVSNVLLVDIDTVMVNIPLMERMTNRFSDLIVVYTAAREAAMKRIMRPGTQDFVPKPATLNSANINRYLTLIIGRLQGVTSAKNATVNYKDVAKTVGTGDKIIAIAASTGGVEALEKVISKLPVNVPPILLVQHMPSGFTKMFAERLNAIYPLNVKEAETGDFLLQGQLLIAPAGNHMKLIQRNNKLAVDCFLGPKMHGVIPAADILFESVADVLRSSAIGVILTGMGADGARGLMLMHNNGAKTIGQNEETCVVYGMPKVARDLGAIDFELPIENIAEKIMSLV